MDNKKIDEKIERIEKIKQNMKQEMIELNILEYELGAYYGYQTCLDEKNKKE